MEIKTFGSQKESQIINIGKKESILLHYDIDYDTTKPEDGIRGFVDNILGMLSRYEGNKLRIVEIEAELNDLEHYMEIGNFKNVPDGYRLYRKLAELRRERRACKSENDLLWPIYEYFHATEVLNRLTHVQGECAKAKGAIDGRSYQVRTEVLDEWLEEKKPEKKEEPEEAFGGGIDLNDTSWLPDLEVGDDVFKVMESAEKITKIEQAQKEVDKRLQHAKYSLAWRANEA